MVDIILALAIISVLWGVVSSIKIIMYLSERGFKINYFLLKLLIIKYARQYYILTKGEEGKPGPWFYSFVGSMNLGLVLAIIGLVLKSNS